MCWYALVRLHQEESLSLLEGAVNRLMCAVVGFSLLVFSSISLAQSKLTPAGRWEGSIVAPSGELKVVVDLDRDSDGSWIGDIDIPQQGVVDLPLKSISVSNNAVTFELPAGPGGPRFQGKLSDDGNALAGEFMQAGSSFPLSMKRAGEAKVQPAARNPELPEKFIGKWEGSLETPRRNKGRRPGSAMGMDQEPAPA